MGTYSHSGIELYIHTCTKSLFRLKHKTAHHQSKLALIFHLLRLPIWSSNKTQSRFVYIIEAQDIFQGKDDIGRQA